MTDKKNNFAKDINVPSKEQIIIDGIQFNEFGDFYVDYDFNGKFQSISSSSKEYKILKSLIEQLARKTQECELLETQLESYHIGEPKLIQRGQELQQECEELKSEAFTREELITIQENDINRYRKAFEEIEEYCNMTGDLPYRTTASEILNIISRVKGKE